MLRVLDLHMGGELIGEAADFAAAHRIGLAGERERPHAGSSDPPGEQMAVDDRIDLVDAAGRLVDALRIQRDDALGLGEPVEEAFDRTTGQPADGCGVRDGLAGDLCKGRLRAGGEFADEGAVDRVGFRQMRQQSVEQHRIAAGAQRQMQIRALAGRGPARVDDDDAAIGILRFCRQHARMQDRMAPGGVGADQHQQIGLFQIFIATGNRVAAEGALVADHAGGHAQPRIGVDIGGADKPLRELVDDVVILGEQLARNVEGHRIRPVLADRFAESVGDMRQRGIPACRLSVDHGLEQAPFEPDGFGQRRSLGAELAEIGGMQGIAADGDRTRRVPLSQDAAADAAIGTGGLDCHARYPQSAETAAA